MSNRISAVLILLAFVLVACVGDAGGDDGAGGAGGAGEVEHVGTAEQADDGGGCCCATVTPDGNGGQCHEAASEKSCTMFEYWFPEKCPTTICLAVAPVGTAGFTGWAVVPLLAAVVRCLRRRAKR